MNQIQEQENSSIDYLNVDGSDQLPVNTNGSITKQYKILEDLSNEIIYEIFEFLDAHHIYEAFFNLNTRFQNLLTHSNFLIQVDTSNISKSSFQSYYKQFMLPNIHRIRSLNLLNSFVINLIFPSHENITLFTQLETLILNNIYLVTLENLLKYLPSLSKLSSLIINSINKYSNDDTLYEKIFRLPALKYCVLSLGDSDTSDPVIIDRLNFIPIEHLVINNSIHLNRLASLLKYVPNLRRLSINYLTCRDNRETGIFWTNLTKLTHISVTLKDIRFDRFESFIRDFIPHLQVLHISTRDNNEYLNAEKWEQMILSSMPFLRIFDFQHIHRIDTSKCQTLMDQFKTSFWSERKWFFAHQHNWLDSSNRGIFYSIQPYRRRHYTLSNKHNQCSYSCHNKSSFATVRHVYIETKSIIDNHSIYFPNVTELTLTDDLYRSCQSIANTVGRIIPLSQLSKIIINSDHIYFNDIIKMLCLTPNCYKLILNSTLPDEADLLSVQCSENFRFLSNKNNIKDFTAKSWCSLKDVELLADLCPRVQHLTINVLQNDFQSILKYLLKKNGNTRHLISLNIQSTGDIWLEKLINTMTEARQSDDVSVEVVGYFQCRLWL